MMNIEPVSISLDGTTTVSGLLMQPARAIACYVFAHGAGAGMTHPFMTAIAEALGQRNIATLRYQFPYMERGGKRPDQPALAQKTVRAAVLEVSRWLPWLPLIAGGKSFGGRMTSQAQAAEPLPNVRGLAFLGFPLHPAGKLSEDRAVHLFEVQIPMLFLQGSRDLLADLALMRNVSAALGPRATLRVFEDADHSFHVSKRSSMSDAEILTALCNAFASWAVQIIDR